MAGALSYIHVTMELRLDSIHDLILRYRATLTDLGDVAAQNSYKRTWNQAAEYYDNNIKDLLDKTEKRFVEMIGHHSWVSFDLEQQLLNLQRLLPEGRRDRRSIAGLVIGTFMGLYNRKQLETLKLKINSLGNQQVHHFSILQNHTALISKIQVEMDMLSKALQTVTLANPAFIISGLLKTENHIRRSL